MVGLRPALALISCVGTCAGASCSDQSTGRARDLGPSAMAADAGNVDSGGGVVPGPPPSRFAHDYFNALVARADHWKSYSLRDAAQVVSLKTSNSLPPSVTYDFANDPDPRKQDAAKVLIPAQVVSIPNQLRLPVGTEDGHTYLFTWDAWFGAELRYANTGISNYKTFQFSSPRTPGGADTIWFEINNRWSLAPNEAGLAGVRYYATASTMNGPNVTSTDPLGPTSGTFTIRSETWTRYWVKITQRANDYELVSLWVGDENNDAVQIIDELQFAVFGSVVQFWLEYNTSTTSTGAGDRVSYARNWVALRDIADVSSVFQRPLR
jgi:hypothetical protein